MIRVDQLTKEEVDDYVKVLVATYTAHNIVIESKDFDSAETYIGGYWKDGGMNYYGALNDQQLITPIEGRPYYNKIMAYVLSGKSD